MSNTTQQQIRIEAGNYVAIVAHLYSTILEGGAQWRRILRALAPMSMIYAHAQHTCSGMGPTLSDSDGYVAKSGALLLICD